MTKRTEHERILRLRFSFPRHSYKAISRITKTPASTVQHLCARYLQRGSLEDRRSTNGRKCPAIDDRKLAAITSQLMLFRQQGLGLNRRCLQIERQLGVKMSRTRLRSIYKAHRIAYGRPDVIYDRAIERQDELNLQRRKFAQRLVALQAEGVEIVYMDESSFQSQIYKPLKVWQRVAQPIIIQTPIRRPPNLTLFGAVGLQMSPLFMDAEGTTTAEMQKFLGLLIEHVQHRRIVLVLDNATAHTARASRDLAEQLGITLMFLPPYTCRMNPQERVWALVKREYRQMLA